MGHNGGYMLPLAIKITDISNYKKLYKMTETMNKHQRANGVFCKPILFSTPMVQAILKGDKTQTRRKIKHKAKIEEVRIIVKCVENENDWGKYILTDELGEDFLIKPRYNIGDFIWVRETWQHTKCLNINPEDENYGFVYKADGQPWENYENWKWKPSIFMPKNACRIFLKVTNIRIERLDAISETDAIKEGIELVEYNCFKNYMQGKDWFYNHKNQNGFEILEDPIDSFFSLWVKINGQESLDNNPWVFVYEFERTDAPACL